MLNICSDPHRAKDICRKYCGLCDMGKFIKVFSGGLCSYFFSNMPV